MNFCNYQLKNTKGRQIAFKDIDDWVNTGKEACIDSNVKILSIKQTVREFHNRRLE